jgi:hypothetical protein
VIFLAGVFFADLVAAFVVFFTAMVVPSLGGLMVEVVLC